MTTAVLGLRPRAVAATSSKSRCGSRATRFAVVLIMVTLSLLAQVGGGSWRPTRTHSCGRAHVPQQRKHLSSWEWEEEDEEMAGAFGSAPPGNEWASELPRSSDVNVLFLGTASQRPTPARACCSVAVSVARTRGTSTVGRKQQTKRGIDVSIVDAGPGVQLSLQKSQIHPKRVNRILLSSLNGDRVLGLFSLLTYLGDAHRTEPYAGGVKRGRNTFTSQMLMGRKKAGLDGSYSSKSTNYPLEIYGPEGTRALVRTVLKLTFTKMRIPFRVIEFKTVPCLRGSGGKFKNYSAVARSSGCSIMQRRAAGEVIGGCCQSESLLLGDDDGDDHDDDEEIFPEDGVWRLELDEEGRRICPKKGSSSMMMESSHGRQHQQRPTRRGGGGLNIYAAAVNHTIPSLAFVFQIDSARGRMNSSMVQKAWERNLPFFQQRASSSKSSTAPSSPLLNFLRQRKREKEQQQQQQQQQTTTKTKQATRNLTSSFPSSSSSKENATSTGALSFSSQSSSSSSSSSSSPLMYLPPSLLAALASKPYLLYKLVQKLSSSQNLLLPDGTTINRTNAFSLPKPDRKIVLVGDASGSSTELERLAANATLLIHEATHALFNRSRVGILEDVEDIPTVLGHSTAERAGDFAKKIGCQVLVLSHFSRVYGGDASNASARMMSRVEEVARKASDLQGHRVIAAWDGLSLPVPHHDKIWS